ncbi:protein numb homolog [Sinocyclocheilus grahami]|uniref:protein numb homolog n=1 Tax=Sinocyclocheilus grahami TaxID=75366 RepID=UPI0007ACB6D9|nr:PREDICTED: protein numb homolog [Sinocyclocheilus grahami]
MATLALQEANPHAIPRRHATVDAIARQGSFRGFPALSQKTSPFKRQMSLRMNELPSTMQRKSDFPIKNTGSEWPNPTPAAGALPTVNANLSTLASSHKRTPSEADRWLEEVTKSVRAHQPAAVTRTNTPPTQQPFPSPAPTPMTSGPSAPFMPGIPPSAVPTVPPRQSAFHAQAPASFPVSNGIPFVQPTFPVVGITPSQMVANVFGSATQTQPIPVPVQVPQAQLQSSPFSTPPTGQFDTQAVCSPFGKPLLPPVTNATVLQPPKVNATFNGANSWAAVSSPAQSVAVQQQADAFEAQWAALESRSQQRTAPSPTNPFSTELHKTFEIQL